MECKTSYACIYVTTPHAHFAIPGTDGLPWPLNALASTRKTHQFAKWLTSAMRCTPAPLSIGRACSDTGSFTVVAWNTPVGYCRPKCCAWATALTICRSSRGSTTADGCSEEANWKRSYKRLHGVLQCMANFTTWPFVCTTYTMYAEETSGEHVGMASALLRGCHL